MSAGSPVAAPRASVDIVRAAVGAVPDPEVPVLSIADLGVLRGVEETPEGPLRVTVTPTYSGCPALDAITGEIRRVLDTQGHPDAEVRLVLTPAWTTDWMTDRGRRALAAYGMAPPGHLASGGPGPVPLALSVRCPRCGSPDTREQSRYGSTACTSLWVCRSCREPFPHFKAI